MLDNQTQYATDHNAIKLAAKIAKLAAEIDAIDAAEQTKRTEEAAFPTGPGSGTAVHRRQHGRRLDASITRSVRRIAAENRLRVLTARYERYIAGQVDKLGRERPAFELVRLRRQLDAVLRGCDGEPRRDGTLYTDAELECLAEIRADLESRVKTLTKRVARAQPTLSPPDACHDGVGVRA
ncbi:hypothetical protein [Gemmatimonas sp.]|uniref:hypothetical protein n=1 Tax=Gemmatimonas sp. TaxID=1962908 RepID=UPI00286E03EF|nr:hypothetical protein [Gemmatimonas sp.]